ncbi:hypothetical protein AK830_g2030 [Neonectria ditissima]|uniref:FHA domain-containing protein n=1 Tax=Neonectria ditissima TaxID=78410 RepID=A0A0P7BCM5_9HYPO|nr:hypothetical protein AK830_g2030 [Neonectria ditissima]
MKAEGSAKLRAPTNLVNPSKPDTHEEPDSLSIDTSSTICVLHPTSETARLVAQHLLDEDSPYAFVKASGIKQFRDKDSPQNLDYKLHPDLDFHLESLSRHDVGDCATILNISTKPKNPAVGYTFGRHPSRCDIALVNDPHRRISNMHFSISINEDGTPIIEHHLTNGTVVDGQMLDRNLTAKGKTGPTVTKLTLVSGMVVNIPLHDVTLDLKFRVQTPNRDVIQKEIYAQNAKNFLI